MINLFASPLLRRHVSWRTCNSTYDRTITELIRIIRALLRLWSTISNSLLKAPIHDLNFAEVTDQNVLWLEVSVNVALIMSRPDGVTNTLKNINEPFTRVIPNNIRLPPIQAFDDRLQGHTSHTLHGEIHTPGSAFVDLMHRNNVGMLEFRHHASFAHETGFFGVTDLGVGMQCFQCHLAIQIRIVSLVNDPGPARA